MRFSELLNRKVVTESGRKLGHVHDLRAVRRGDRLLVTGLLVGRHALLEHFGLSIARGRSGTKMRNSVDVVPWDAVLRLVPGRVVVRDGTELPRAR
jgi:sporulation protein YlmC with PRC-barrel domain